MPLQVDDTFNYLFDFVKLFPDRGFVKQNPVKSRHSQKEGEVGGS
jgi:hypothetical protein